MSEMPYCWPDTNSVRNDRFDTVKDGLFHVGQCYEKSVAETVRCLGCGGKKFYVGQGSYFTAIKCVTCRWEHCIHDG